MKQKLIDELKGRLRDIAHLNAVNSLVSWDQEVNMPEKGADMRSSSLAALSSIIHEKFLDLDAGGLLTGLKRELDSKKLKGKDATIVRETWRTFDRERKLPEAFVHEYAEVISKSQNAWTTARAKNDFKSFLPHLRKVVELKRKEAQLVGYEKSPYDALIDQHEPGMTAESLAIILADLKDILVPLLKRIKTSQIVLDRTLVRGAFPTEKQFALNRFVAETIGFDFQAGRLDVSTHPFSSGFHPRDVRITTRYKENDVLDSLMSTMHETGHGLYEQGLPFEHVGTPLSDSVSMGIHESQSRLWENMIGRSRGFWTYMYQHLKKAFPVPFKSLPLAKFYGALNAVQPSLIRVEADEVTYNLHIIIRFEIEKEIIEGTIDLKDLPEIWSAKYKEYLGITVPSDTFGVLQDVHWSIGYFGYFPSYSLGNLYAAQFFAKMHKDIPNLNTQIENGQFDVILTWLRMNIHERGKTYFAQDLIKKVTGEYPTSRYFGEYLNKKYSEIYRL